MFCVIGAIHTFLCRFKDVNSAVFHQLYKKRMLTKCQKGGIFLFCFLKVLFVDIVIHFVKHFVTGPYIVLLIYRMSLSLFKKNKKQKFPEYDL